MAKVDLPIVKELMGHKRIDITMRYVQLSPDHKRAAITVLDQFADKVPEKFTTVEKAAGKQSLQLIEMALSSC